jgi:hypothetical protein
MELQVCGEYPLPCRDLSRKHSIDFYRLEQSKDGLSVGHVWRSFDKKATTFYKGPRGTPGKSALRVMDAFA